MQYYCDKYASCLVRSRKDLLSNEHQAIMQRAAKDRRMFDCGCCIRMKFKLIPFKLPGTCIYILRRRRISDPHLKGCFAEELEPIFDKKDRSGSVNYTERMLMEDDGRDGHPARGMTERHADGSGERYEEFVHFFQAQFTRASVETFRTVNAGKSFRDTALVNPSRAMVFGRLAELFYEPLMRRNTLSLVSALKKLGLRLFWGVTAQPLVDESDRPLEEDEVFQFEVSGYWESHGFQPTHALLEFSPTVLSASRGKAKAMVHVIPPPYLYAAVVEPSGTAYRVIHFFRVPVSIENNCIFIIESETERRSLRVILKAGVAFIKPHVQADLRALGGELWPFKTNKLGRLPSRPDVIAFIDGKVWIFYITDSRDGKYLEDVAESVAELKLFLANSNVLVLPKTAESFADGSWLQLPT
jgi:hypothetical protein